MNIVGFDSTVQYDCPSFFSVAVIDSFASFIEGNVSPIVSKDIISRVIRSRIE
jgi:hypothetical protein